VDCNGCSLAGPAQVARARILWHAGRLYWATSKTDVHSVAMTTAPVKAGGGFQGQTDSGVKVRIRLPGCGCKKIAALVGVPASELIAAAKVVA